jgi:uncharacterized YigZ family protein
MIKSKDTYRSVKIISKGLFKDKGSKFLSFACPVSDENEVKNILKDIKKQYHDARHHCYAYNIGTGGDRYRMNDDGEPSGTAGKPIYGQIVSHGMSDVLIVVVRYFGGTLLGTSGLISAYKNAAINALQNAEIFEKQITCQLEMQFSYEQLSLVMRNIKAQNLEIVEQNFTNSCRLVIQVRESLFDTVKKMFNEIYGVEIITE